MIRISGKFILEVVDGSNGSIVIANDDGKEVLIFFFLQKDVLFLEGMQMRVS